MADAMAASSGGVEWSSVLKPFLAHQYETSNRTEIIELCSTIIKCEAQILRHKENNRKFYNNFVVLSADYISSCASKLPVSQIDTVSAACRVLLKYLVNCLQSLASDSNQNSAQIEFYLNAVKVLCIGTSPLSTAEVSILVDTMKGENLPQHVNANPPGAEKDTPNKQESSKTRSDLSMEIFEQLTLPLRDGQTTTRDGSSGGSSSSQGANLTEIAPTNDPISDINKLFLKTNTESLQALRAGDTLVDLCLSLHSIKKARTKVEEALAGKPFSIPTTQSEASAMKNSIYTNISEIKLAMSAINLPVLEPLTPSKLDKLSTLGMAVLHCAVSQAAASAILSACTAISPKCSAQQSQTGPKEDEFDNQAVTLVEEALNMYSYIGTTIKNSTRAGGHVYQNHLLAGAWVLVSGLQSHLTASTASAPEKSPHSREREEKGRSPCKSRECGTATSSSSRTSLQKFQQSFGVLSVAIAAKALTLLTELFEDLYLEACGGAGNIGQIEPAPLTIMGQFTALQRVARVLGAAPLNNFLFYLAVVSYGKACSLKRLDPPEGDTFSQSDSTTYYEDMIIVSDESSIDDDDDSEPILGQWFEETLAPPETADPKSPSSPDHFEGGKSAQPTTTEASVIPEKGEAHGYITLATNIFVFMNKHLLCTRSSYVSRYVQKGLTEQQMLILSAIIRDLDRETSRTESGAISAYFGATLGQLYCEFSGALTKFTHNLVTNQHLTSLQACLLNHLGVSPWNTDVPHGWPLQVYPRTLSVLAQVLLLRPQNEKEASVISIWHRLVNTLIENVLNTPQAGSEAYNEDLNVEHAQVLLYLFHSLNLMQKKSVLLLLAGGVLRCSEVARGSLKDSQLLHLSRLLLLFDYIMKHLYDAPANLLEQVQWNLFFSTNLNSSSKDRENMNRKYTAWQDIEDNYRKISAASEFAMKPRFYVLTTLEINNQDAPKLDGLACNFILGTPDKLRYPLLLDALIEILNVTNLTAGSGASKMTYLGLCSMQYCFTICWRLLQLLPPSVVYMEKLASEERLSAGSLMLHSLIWGPRTSHKNYIRWLKDCMNKQGLYTQHTDKLLKSTSDVVNSLKYDADNAKNCILSLTPELKKGVVQKEHLPPLWHLCLLDCLLSKVQVSLDATETSSTSSSETNSAAESTAYVQDLFPHVLKLTQVILHCTRWSLLHTIVEQTEPTLKTNPQDFENIQDVLAIASGRNSLTNSLSPELISLLPPSVASVLQQWNSSVLEDVTSAPYQNEIIPSESYLLKIIDTHISTISMNSPFTINPSLRRFLQSYVKFICDHASKIENTDTKNRAIEMLVSITLDSRMEYLHDTVSKTLDKLIGDTETDEHQKRVYLQILHHTYKLIINYTSSSVVAAVAAVPSEGAVEAFTLSEQVLHNCLKFYEKILEKSSGRQALESFFTSDKDLVKVLMSVSSPQMSQQYSTRVLHFFNRLFQAAEKSSTDPSLNYLCSSMSKLANVEVEKLQTWLSQIIVGPSAVLVSPSTAAATTATVVKGEEKWTLVGATESNVSSISNDEQKSLIQENSQLLQALTSFIVKQNSNVSEEVALTILKALIPVGTYILSPALEGAGFTDLMVVMTMLADAGSGKGHMHLFPATAEWVELCNRHVAQKEILDNLNSNGDGSKSCVMFDAGCCILDYISDVVNGIQTQQQSGGGGGGSNFRSMSPPWEGETPLDLELDWQEEINHEEEDSGEDSDEDSLSNKLCTFTVTQKEFMNQHWYHCHTCRMLDGVGVCSVCARVCHKGHDISYAKYGNFFCDCGAKEDNTCQALVKRSSAQSDSANPGSNQQQQGENNTNTGGPELTSSLRRRTSSPSGGPYDKVKPREKKHINVKQLQNSKEWIVNYLGTSCIVPTLIDFMNALMASVEVACNQSSPVGCYARAVKALQQLHSAEKKYRFTDQLMLVTVGSQEGAFENVRLSYAGEQGQTIRQLLSAHIIRRVAMCCMTSAVAAAASSASSSHGGRRQHLAVSHEKGKITVLQLSALLKQNESSSTRKLTLSKLGSAPIPFTVLSLSSNPCNEDFLAVCGLKDCHVLTFTSAGVVLDHLVLHPQLETGNFIIKVVWLPGSQTRMALVTADFVKIYDLSRDMLSPQYYFLVPSGKIRDCTFMCDEGTYHILLMSSPGHIYTEVLNEDSSAKHGTFYVTNTLEVFHLDVTDVNGQVAGGGVSIYYSHTLGLLFYSYAQGKNFISPITPKNNCLTVVFPIVLAPVAASGTGGNKGNGPRNAAPQPLCQWMEVTNHPGLVICALQSSNNPVILMLTPETILIQEMKSAPPKTKITDMVALRHYSGGNEPRTTLMLLCEDGSLKMSVANMETTGYWMSPNMQPTIAGSSAAMKPKKKKQVKTGKTSGSVSFPVDFFEHCQLMNDVEFGGNDLLQIYNTAQLKHRLNATGLYVACNKPLGFTVEITNADVNMVMMGLRVLVGSQDVQRAPSFVEVFGRIISLTVTRSRWYDIPFSREESLQADKKLSVMFGPSQDPETLTMVDSIKVYGKTKDTFGWPEETEEAVTTTTTNGNTQSANAVATDTESQTTTVAPVTKLEKLVVGILEALDGSFSLHSLDDKLRQPTLKIATQLLTLPTPPLIQVHSKALLSSLHSSRPLYHNYKDHALLQHVLSSLNVMTESDTKEIDAESFYRLILIVRGIAVARPQNLVKFCDSHTGIQDVVLDDPLDSKATTTATGGSSSVTTSKTSKSQHILLKLMDVLWLLHSLNPDNPSLAPVVVPGLKHTEQVIHALVEIVHAFNSCDTYSNITMAVYLQLLLCKDSMIAFSAKQALSKVLKPKVKKKRVVIPEEEEQCSTPPPAKSAEAHEPKPSTSNGGGGGSSSSTSSGRSAANRDDNQEDNQGRQYDVAAAEAMVLLQQQAGVSNDNQHNVIVSHNALEALLGGAGGFQPLLDIPPDADDETMVELAIALSLQEHDIGGGHHHGLLTNEELAQVAQVGQGAQGQEAGHFSDTTASAAGSDDEGSTAATDGSTLRTSPADQGGGSAAGSESGGSGVESITGEHNVSGRSSAYGDDKDIVVISAPRSGDGAQTASNPSAFPPATVATTLDSSALLTQEQQQEAIDAEIDSENSGRLHVLRLQLLERLTEYLPKLRNVDGVRAIPFLQVVLQLSSELDGHSDRDRACFSALLGAVILELDLNQPNAKDKDICVRSTQKEVQLVLMKLLSVFMGRTRSSSSTSSSSTATSSTAVTVAATASTSTTTAASKSSQTDTSSFVCRTTATVLHKANTISYCNGLLQSLLAYWTSANGDDNKAASSGNLLKEHLTRPPPDMTPFFLKQFVKENGPDFFGTYPELLTEMALRLPYQVHKYSEVSEPTAAAFDGSWFQYLCDYMMTSQTPTVRRQVRKLLLFICGSKEKYRQHRDLHALCAHMKGVKNCCIKGGYEPSLNVQHSLSLTYDNLVDLVEHLKGCVEVAVNRTGNWQRYCLKNDDTIAFLVQISCLLEEGVAPTILNLLQCAIANGGVGAGKASKSSGEGGSAKEKQQQQQQGTSGSSSRKDREKSDDSATDAVFEESNCVQLVEQINRQVSREVFACFVKTFMLETNTTSVRWQAHALIQAIYKNSKAPEQESLLRLLWQLWPLIANYGRKASQFVDLLGYFSLRFFQNNFVLPQVTEYVDRAVNILMTQNELLAHHPNANLYTHMSQFVELDGYYLESEPCLVCNNPEVNFANIKLSSLKVDSKFTTTTQIVKLLNSHTISRITVRIGDLKRSKMVRTINIYYNNRSVQAVVELKNKPALWHKAKKVTVPSGQTEVKIEFPLPIVACNLMVEYADFYENIQASSETLQCPRCSAAVPANPGVCANCGENVFQCHKCRAINYDEKDPFLCHACGFCKYAKFDFSLLAKPCCAVEPIENDEDRKKTVASINSLLERADRSYKQLIANKPALESLVLKVTEHRSEGKGKEEGGGGRPEMPPRRRRRPMPPLRPPLPPPPPQRSGPR